MSRIRAFLAASRRPGLRAALAFLVVFHAAVFCAEFLAPCGETDQDRGYVYGPPTPLYWLDPASHRFIGPFVCGSIPLAGGAYQPDCRRRFALLLFPAVSPYRLAGVLPLSHRLLAPASPGLWHPLGTDALGRDVFSRILFGARSSLTVGWLATLLTLMIGAPLGLAAGYLGGWADELLMRLAEVFLALPWLYLLLAVRAFLPISLAPSQASLLLVVLIGITGWARPARLARGIALSARERPYVQAARGFGASGPYLVFRHLLPEASGVLLTQAALLLPQYMLAGIALSFLGLGVSEPAADLGTMIGTLRELYAWPLYWWLIAPALVVAVLLACFEGLARSLEAL